MMAREIKQLIEQDGLEEDESTTKPDLLDALLTTTDTDGNELSYTEIRDEIVSFLYKGHHSLSSALLWSLYSLARYPEVQTKVYDEVSRIIEDGEVQWKHLPQLEYLRGFIQEVLRVYTIVPIVDRTLDSPYDIDGIRLEPGTRVQVNIHAAHHNIDSWKNCNEFRPERFVGKDSQEDNSDYLPFSTGTRSCLGRHFTIIALQVLLSRILQTFHIELDPHHPVKPTFVLGYEATTGIKVFIHSR